MKEPTGKLRRLVESLDRLGPSPSLVDLSNTLKAARLTVADVADFVKTNPSAYNRALVALRESYELLVMTWTPGQASPPHDHGGSICAMLTVQGRATEQSFLVADDGYVDPEYQTVIESGDVTAGQDAGVHTIGNDESAAENLVTVHCYAPPLKDLRRFVVRPRLSAEPVHERHTPTVLIVGGGFSGAMTAANLLKQSSARVVLVERRGAVGEGVAYSARESCLRLNVPAGRMSAWPDDPDDFLKWATKHYGPVKPDEFLPRQWYGEYVRDTLLKTAKGGDLSVVLDEVRRVSRLPDGAWMVNLGRGASVRADAVVLAVGHRPPSDPLGKCWKGPRSRYLADPWRPMALHAVGPDDAVVVLGTGLTAVDVVMSLTNQPRTGRVTMVSRRGLTPLPHAQTPVAAVDVSAVFDGTPLTARDLVRRVRSLVDQTVAAGGDWRSVVDGLRPHTAKVWNSLPTDQRKRFLRQLRHFWEVHRHRMPAVVAEKFDRLKQAGTVEVLAGRVTDIVADLESVRMTVRGRGGPVDRQVTWVINCTGPSPSNTPESNPAIGSLLIHGHVCPDELHLGLRTGDDGVAIGSNGLPVDDLYVVGTLRKPALWESTAVPELRVQAAAAAKCVAARLAETRKPGRVAVAP